MIGTETERGDTGRNGEAVPGLPTEDAHGPGDVPARGTVMIGTVGTGMGGTGGGRGPTPGNEGVMTEGGGGQGTEDNFNIGVETGYSDFLVRMVQSQIAVSNSVPFIFHFCGQPIYSICSHFDAYQ